MTMNAKPHLNLNIMDSVHLIFPFVHELCAVSIHWALLKYSLTNCSMGTLRCCLSAAIVYRCHRHRLENTNHNNASLDLKFIMLQY